MNKMPYHCQVDGEDYLTVHSEKDSCYIEIFNFEGVKEFDCAVCLTKKQVKKLIVELEKTI